MSWYLIFLIYIVGAIVSGRALYRKNQDEFEAVKCSLLWPAFAALGLLGVGVMLLASPFFIIAVLLGFTISFKNRKGEDLSRLNTPQPKGKALRFAVTRVLQEETGSKDPRNAIGYYASREEAMEYLKGVSFEDGMKYIYRVVDINNLRLSPLSPEEEAFDVEKDVL